MIKHQTKLRVRYGETDKMGYCYYGVYAQYYEVGRTELIRKLGFSYKELEDEGIIMPVVSMNINYKKPAHYDDELSIITYLKVMPAVKITFYYEVYNQKAELLNTGETILVFVDKKKNKPVRIPERFAEIIQEYF